MSEGGREGSASSASGERMKRERNYEKVNPKYINANTFIFKSEEEERERGLEDCTIHSGELRCLRR